MNIEQVQDKAILFSVDYSLESKDNPQSEDYYAQSESILHKMFRTDPPFALLESNKRDRLCKLASACNTLAMLLKSDLALYEVEGGVAFAMYRHSFDLLESDLFFLAQIANISSSLSFSVSTQLAQTVCLTAVFSLN